MTKLELANLIDNIESVIQDIEKDINKINVKAARQRVRKNSLKLEKLFKEYRKNSVNITK